MQSKRARIGFTALVLSVAVSAGAAQKKEDDETLQEAIEAATLRVSERVNVVGSRDALETVPGAAYVVEAEELGITSANVDKIRSSTKNPIIKRFLGLEGDLHKGLGLNADWAYQVIKQVGNYAEIYNRNLGPDTPFALPRGVNQLWSDGGLLYSPPFR